ncbi:hypothetical protein JX266_012442 [Neoarthrinium moseri]|nr:hypothetical protein JX266_012442 [Neoarthrinium moseri]
MLFQMVLGYVALIGATKALDVQRSAQVCTNSLLIDDFSKWNTSENSLLGATSDDGTMNSTSVTGGVLTFTPNSTATSYMYEQFPCTAAKTQGYDLLSFSIKGPEAASVSLELQTQPNCGAATDSYTSYYYTVNGLAGSMETITVPLSSWTGANLDAIVGVLFYGFSKGMTGTDNVWQIDNIALLCSAGAPVPPPPGGPTTSPTTTSAPGVPGPTTVTVTSTVIVTPTSTSNPWITPGRPTTTTRRTTTRRTTTRRPVPTTSDCDWWDDCDDDGWGGWGRRTAVEEREAPAATQAAIPEAATPVANEACSNLLIDDWISQSRLTFLYYNALLKSSSDDGTMKSIVVSDNKVTLTPSNTDSYFYTQVGCINAQSYGGISLRINAAAGSQFTVQLGSTKGTCGTDDMTTASLTTKQLGWTFDGTDQLYSIPLSKFSGIDLSKFNMIYLTGLKKAVTLGPVAMYCGNEVVEYVAPKPVEPAEPTATVVAPPSKATNLVIDRFGGADTNALGQWHGGDDGITTTFKSNKMTLKTNDSDLMWNTQLTETCRDMTQYQDAYLHIAYSGSNKFSVALQQHNAQCNEAIQPYPETWDSVEAARYASNSDIYIPMNHFNINHTRVIGVALKGFYTLTPTVFSKIEIVSSVPSGWKVPSKLPSGNFVFGCKRPNSFAFAIDDGDPKLAQQVMQTVKDENITVTFFTVGAALQDPTTNLSSLYNGMAAKGHQIAMHSYTHPKLEGLPDEASIDWEYSNMIRAVSDTFKGMHTPYFRAPFGTEGARMRQRLAAVIDDPYIVQWSVDVEDWIWAESTTPEKQLDAFKRDVAKGGNLVVMHYLYPSTVSYLKQFIKIAKATGKQLMRVDQCMMDPNAPPL